MKTIELKKALENAMDEKILTVHLTKKGNIYNVRKLVIVYGAHTVNTVELTIIDNHIHSVNGSISLYDINAIDKIVPSIIA